MNNINRLLLYIRHISFIAFLIAIIVLYPGFKKYNLGNICLFVTFAYIIITFIMFFIKNKYEENSFFNNFVLCFLHIYICYVAYRYYLVKDYAIGGNDNYFGFNFLMISICMIILCFNKILIANNN